VEIYETEEEQVEALKRWWKENGASLIVGVIMALVLVGAWNLWKDYQQDKANQASALYHQLLKSESAAKFDSTEKIAQRLMDQYATTAYADFAALLLAKTKVQQGDLEAAKSVLQQLIVKTEDAEIKNVARVRLVRLMLATVEYEKGLQLIAEADASTSEGFNGGYDELKGDLYVALGRLGEARTAYQSALRSGLISPLLQFKMDDITAADIEEEAVQ